jgi:hypothetical protein
VRSTIRAFVAADNFNVRARKIMLNGVITVLVIGIRSSLPVFVPFVLLATCGMWGTKRETRIPLWAFVSLVVPCLVLCVWGGWNWEAEQHLQDGGWRTRVAQALALVSIFYIVWVPVHFWKRARVWTLAVASLLGLVLVGGGYLMAGMAMSGTWL